MIGKAGAVAACRENRDGDREHQEQDETNPEGWHAEPDQRDYTDDMVGKSTDSGCGEQRQGDRNRDAEGSADNEHAKRYGEGCRDQIADRNLVVDGGSEIAVNQAPGRVDTLNP